MRPNPHPVSDDFIKREVWTHGQTPLQGRGYEGKKETGIHQPGGRVWADPSLERNKPSCVGIKN